MAIGRPRLFTDPDELAERVEAYFEACDKRVQQIYSKKADAVIEIVNPAPYTMSGLAYALGMDRRTLLDYSTQDLFSPTLKAARERIHSDVERRLMETAATGAIFNLKNNFGWVDQTQVKQEVSGQVDVGVVDPIKAQAYADWLKTQ